MFAAAWRGHFEIVKYLIQEQQCQTDVKDEVNDYLHSLYFVEVASACNFLLFVNATSMYCR